MLHSRFLSVGLFMPSRESSRKRQRQIVVGLLLALGVSNLPLGTWVQRTHLFGNLLGNEVPWWLLVIAVLVYVTKGENLPLASIGARNPKLSGALRGLLAGVVMVLGISVLYALIFPVLHLSMPAAKCKYC
jgi:hypothetical protein